MSISQDEDFVKTQFTITPEQARGWLVKYPNLPADQKARYERIAMGEQAKTMSLPSAEPAPATKPQPTQPSQRITSLSQAYILFDELSERKAKGTASARDKQMLMALPRIITSLFQTVKEAMPLVLEPVSLKPYEPKPPAWTLLPECGNPDYRIELDEDGKATPVKIEPLALPEPFSLEIPQLTQQPAQHNGCEYKKYIPALNQLWTLDCRQFRTCPTTRAKLVMRLQYQMEHDHFCLYALVGDKPAGLRADDYTRLVLADRRTLYIISKPVDGAKLVTLDLIRDKNFWDNLLRNMPADAHISGRLLKFWDFWKTPVDGFEVTGYVLIGNAGNLEPVKAAVDKAITEEIAQPITSQDEAQAFVDQMDAVALAAAQDVEDGAASTNPLESTPTLFKRRREKFWIPKSSNTGKVLDDLEQTWRKWWAEVVDAGLNPEEIKAKAERDGIDLAAMRRSSLA